MALSLARNGTGLSSVAVGNYAATNRRGDGYPLFSGIYPALANNRGSGGGAG